MWGTTRTIAQLLRRISHLVDVLSDEEFSHLMQIANRVDRSNKPTIKGNDLVSETKGTSYRALALFATRAHKADAEIVFDRYLKSYNEDNKGILSLIAQIAFQKAFDRPDEWKNALTIIKRAYQKDAIPIFPFSDKIPMPTPIAQEILRGPNQYPLRLIALADAALTKVLGSTAKPVGEIARSGDWFEEGRRKAGSVGT